MIADSPHRAPGGIPLPLAAILAGGRSRRFGASKPLAELDGVPLIQWVRRAVSRVVPEPVVIANEPAPFRGLGMAVRPDAVPGAGPLGGIHAALLWAAEQEVPGALCVACDTPFLPAALLERLVASAARSSAQVFAPQSGGPLGVEPLCAVYGVDCIPEIRRRLDAGEHALGSLFRSLRVETLPLAEVERFGDPELCFLNVNTPAQYERARTLAHRHRGP